MLKKTKDLKGLALDWVVCSIEKPDLTCASLSYQIKNYGKLMLKSSPHGLLSYSPSSHWVQGGPIIEREKIAINCAHDIWNASIDNHPTYYQGYTPLEASMRCYVASKLGDSVEIPEELIGE